MGPGDALVKVLLMCSGEQAAACVLLCLTEALPACPPKGTKAEFAAQAPSPPAAVLAFQQHPRTGQPAIISMN